MPVLASVPRVRSGIGGGVGITGGGRMSDTAGLGIEAMGDSRGYIALNMLDICCRPCITGSPTFIPGSSDVE